MNNNTHSNYIDASSILPQAAQDKLKKYDHKFVQVPKWVLSPQVLPYLKGSELRVLNYLCARMDNSSYTTWAKRKQIAECTGVALSSISSITASLAFYSIVGKRDRGARCEYKVSMTPPQWWLTGGLLKGKHDERVTKKRRAVAKANFSQDYAAEIDVNTIPP